MNDSVKLLFCGNVLGCFSGMNKGYSDLSEGRIDTVTEFWSRLGRVGKDAAFLLVIAANLFLLLAIFSYDPRDPGWSHLGYQSSVSNLTGRAGSWVADLFISIVGCGAYLLPLLIIWPSVHLIRLKKVNVMERIPFFVLRTTGAILLLLSFATLSAMHQSNKTLEYPFTAGGVVGQALSDLSVNWLSIVGSTIAWGALFLLGLTLYLEISPSRLIERIGGAVLSLPERIENHLDQRQEKREAKEALKAQQREQAAAAALKAQEEFEAKQALLKSQQEAAAPKSRVSNPFARRVASEPKLDEPAIAPTTARAIDEPPFESRTSEAPPEEPRFSAVDAEDIIRARTYPQHEDAMVASKDDQDALVDELVANTPVFAEPQRDVQIPTLMDEAKIHEDEADADRDAYADDPLMQDWKWQDEHSDEQPPFIDPLDYETLAADQHAHGQAADFVNTTDADVQAAAAIQATEPVNTQNFGGSRTEIPETASQPYVASTFEDEPKKGVKIVPLSQTHKPLPADEAHERHTAPQMPTKPTYQLPSLDLLDPPEIRTDVGYSEEQLEQMSRLLEEKLKDFNVIAEVVEVNPGPVITRFELQPAPGVKASKISNLARDLARSMAVLSVRVVEVIPGKSVIGIEIPNETRLTVHLSEVLNSKPYLEAASKLTLALGNDIAGNPVVANLAKMPHLLVAGTTGSGKSVGVNAMILSLLYRAGPDEVRLMLVDPKMLELSIYEGIPHLLTPVITDMKEAAGGLRWCVGEMERRYRLMAKMGVRNLAGFNDKIRKAQEAGEPIQDPLWNPQEQLDPDEPAPYLEPLPYIVVVIDEFADMMMMVGKKVEELIARIAQKARAAGIHLILATQRPSVDVITGLIKANIPTRIAFQVSSKIDSRTILDQAGAENLLGWGDMLYVPAGTSVPNRVHGAFVSDDEVHRTVEAWKAVGAPQYLDEILNETQATESSGGGLFEDDEADPLYDEAVAFVTESRKASISAVQRKLKIGYNRAARMVESMEAAGVVSEAGSNGQREVLAPPPPRD